MRYEVYGGERSPATFHTQKEVTDYLRGFPPDSMDGFDVYRFDDDQHIEFVDAISGWGFLDFGGWGMKAR